MMYCDGDSAKGSRDGPRESILLWLRTAAGPELAASSQGDVQFVEKPEIKVYCAIY